MDGLQERPSSPPWHHTNPMARIHPDWEEAPVLSRIMDRLGQKGGGRRRRDRRLGQVGWASYGFLWPGGIHACDATNVLPGWACYVCRRLGSILLVQKDQALGDDVCHLLRCY
eukprot:585360-Pelagomonas_calceolata.AAC.4